MGVTYEQNVPCDKNTLYQHFYKAWLYRKDHSLLSLVL